MTEPDAAWEIHVLGGGIGESIVMRLPDGEWGVVDCCATHSADPERNATLKLLQARGVTRLAFLCLTHPHADHYRGMGLLFEHLSVERFWLFPLGGVNLAQLLRALRTRALHDVAREADARELENLLYAILQRAKAGTLQLDFIQARTRLRDTPPQVDALTPNGNDIVRYCLPLGQSLATPPPEPLPALRHNRISGVLRFSYGETVVILGADASPGLWEAALHSFPSRRFSAHLVKVSHHGSPTGRAPGLWEAFSRPIAVITPYTPSRLPPLSMLEYIDQYAASRHITANPLSERQGLTFPRGTPPTVQIDLQSDPHLLGFVPFASSNGCCSFAFDDLGHCVSSTPSSNHFL